MSGENKLFDIRDWVPFQLWQLSQEAGYILENSYSGKYNITGDSWRFMAMLACSAPVSAKKLGQYLDMDQVQVTRALGKLVDNGYITRRTDPCDRRRAILKLSSKGVEIYQAIVGMAVTLEQKLLAEISPEDQKKFRQTLKSLLATVKQTYTDNAE